MKILQLCVLSLICVVVLSGISLAQHSNIRLEKKDVDKILKSMTPSDTSVEQLCKLIVDSSADEVVRAKAITRLGEMFEKEDAKNKISEKVYKLVIDALISSLEEGSDRIIRVGNVQVNLFWAIRSAAADAIANLKDSVFIPYMIKALRYDNDPVVKRSIALSFGKMKSKESVPVLIETLEYSKDQGLAYDIVKALGQIGDKRAFGTLIKVMRGDFMPKVKEMAQESIEMIEWAEEPAEVAR